MKLVTPSPLKHYLLSQLSCHHIFLVSYVTYYVLLLHLLWFILLLRECSSFQSLVLGCLFFSALLPSITYLLSRFEKLYTCFYLLPWHFLSLSEGDNLWSPEGSWLFFSDESWMSTEGASEFCGCISAIFTKLRFQRRGRGRHNPVSIF